MNNKKITGMTLKEIDVMEKAISLALKEKDAEISKAIDEWAKIECLDGFIKCYECIEELKQKLGVGE